MTTSLQKLLQIGAPDFLPFVRPDLQVAEPPPTVPEREFFHTDGLIRCRDAQGRALLVHFEFQHHNDARMCERLMAYSVLVSRRNDYLPVISCVIYLNNDMSIPQPPFVRRLPNGNVTSRFHYICLQIGQIKAQDLLTTQRDALLPFLPLTDGGDTVEQVDLMLTKLLTKHQPDLLWIGLCLAGNALKGEQNLTWLREKLAMLRPALAGSLLYQNVIAQGIAAGRAEAAAIRRANEKRLATASSQHYVAESVVRLIAARFPALQALAHQCALKSMDDVETCTELLIAISSAQGEQEVRRLLEANSNLT